jgi:16S rRNA (guanine966-N2)-methyltransferase
MLETIAEDWNTVLDLFSGSGALGIEALSRGAEWVDFVERDRRCCDIIRQNLEKTRFTDRARVYCRDVDKAILFLNKEYSIVLIDPPYPNPSIGRLVTRLAKSRLIGAESTIVVTHSPRRTLDMSYGPLKMIKERRHGDSCISVYRKENSP